MASRIHTLTVDCRRPWELAQFWSALLDWPIAGGDGPDDDEVLVEPRAAGPAPLLFIEVPEVKAGKNRLHLDITPDDQAAEVERALGLGATRAEVGQTGDESWVVLADPEGNEFCILRPR